MSDRIAILVCLLGLVASCKDKSAGGMPGREIPIEDYQAEYMKASCAYLVRCGFSPDQATCLESDDFFTPSQSFATALSDVKAKRIDYDPAVAATCLDVLAGRACASLTVSQPHACDGLFAGTVAAGGACLIDAECARGSCEPTDPACAAQCCAGTCIAAPAVVALGGDCSAGQPCATGTYCSQAGVCSPLIDGPGTFCRSIEDCTAPLVCEGSKGCLPQAPIGEACDPARSFACLDSARSYCDPASGRCTARGHVGDACVALGETQVSGSCLSYERCDPATMKCVLAARLGAACSTTDRYPCQGVLTCNAGSQTCVQPPPATACM